MAAPLRLRSVLSLCVLMTLCLAQEQPHILLVVADDLGWQDIGYHGRVEEQENHSLNSKIETPVLDQLASEGLKLENYYVQPSCTPSRSVLLSGRYQVNIAVLHPLSVRYNNITAVWLLPSKYSGKYSGSSPATR